MNKIYLAVPFIEKDNAKTLGAKWDGECKKWYTMKNSKNRIELLDKYKINDTPVQLVGEDRTFGGNELFVDLIPSTCWFSNVRHCIHPTDWDRVRNHIYERTQYICECCGVNTKIDTNSKLEAHERWDYDEVNKVQKLTRIVSLCSNCHQSTHIGMAGINGKRKEAESHLKQVRNFTNDQVNIHITDAFDLWRKRNQYAWKLDITLITNNGIKIKNDGFGQAPQDSAIKRNPFIKCIVCDCNDENDEIKKFQLCTSCFDDIKSESYPTPWLDSFDDVIKKCPKYIEYINFLPKGKCIVSL